MATIRQIVQHPRSGERYILEISDASSRPVYRAAGPLGPFDNPNDGEMHDWLNNQNSTDATDDGEWLARELNA